MSNLAKRESDGLIAAMAAEYSLKPGDFWDTVRAICGCPNASNADFITMLSVARDMHLSPLKKEVWLINIGGKPTISIAADGYLQMLARQPDNAGVEYEEGWFPDVRKAPDAHGKHPLSRGGKVTLHRKSWRKPYVHTEWWDEVERTNKSPLWRDKGSRMLRHRAMSQAIRNAYGTYLPDEDEIRWRGAESEDDEPRSVQAEIAPAVEIEPLGGAGDVASEAVSDGVDGTVDRPAPSEEFDPEESKRLDALDAGLFDV